MTTPTPTPRQRLADAVKALDAAKRDYKPADDVLRYGEYGVSVNARSAQEHRRRSALATALDDAKKAVIAAARAVLTAPDDAESLTFGGSALLHHDDNFTVIRFERVLSDAEVAAVLRAADPNAPNSARNWG